MVFIQDDMGVTTASIAWNVKFLSVLGLWPSTTSDSMWKLLITNLIFVLAFLIMNLSFISLLLGIFLNSATVHEILYSVYTATVALNCIFKQTYIRYKTKDFQELVARIETMFIKANNPLKQQKEKIIHSGNYTTKMLLCAVSIPCLLAGFFTPLIPLTTNADHTMRKLPYDGWFPCNKTESPCYEIAYLLLSANCVIMNFYISSTNVLIASLIIQTFKQFDILQMLFLNIRKIAKEDIANDYKKEQHLSVMHESSSLQSNQYEIEYKREAAGMHQVLLRTIHDHLNLLSFAEQLKILASSFLIIQMAVDVVILCVLTMQFLLLESYFSFQFISSFSVYIAAVSILGMICWCGGELAHKSAGVGSAAFESEWYMADSRTKRSLQIVMMRSKYPCKITIAKIMDFNLISFTAVLRASYSYFTVLKETTMA